jgi:hypothetical protein
MTRFTLFAVLFSCGTFCSRNLRSSPMGLATHRNSFMFLLYRGMINHTHPVTASISNIAISAGPNIYLPSAWTHATIISLLISDFRYIRGFFYAERVSRAEFL